MANSFADERPEMEVLGNGRALDPRVKVTHEIKFTKRGKTCGPG